jgi:hypothetical protein
LVVEGEHDLGAFNVFYDQLYGCHFVSYGYVSDPKDAVCSGNTRLKCVDIDLL